MTRWEATTFPGLHSASVDRLVRHPRVHTPTRTGPSKGSLRDLECPGGTGAKERTFVQRRSNGFDSKGNGGSHAVIHMDTAHIQVKNGEAHSRISQNRVTCAFPVSVVGVEVQ